MFRATPGESSDEILLAKHLMAAALLGSISPPRLVLESLMLRHARQQARKRGTVRSPEGIHLQSHSGLKMQRQMQQGFASIGVSSGMSLSPTPFNSGFDCSLTEKNISEHVNPICKTM